MGIQNLVFSHLNPKRKIQSKPPRWTGCLFWREWHLSFHLVPLSKPLHTLRARNLQFTKKYFFIAKLKISPIACGGTKLGRVQGRSCSLGVIFGALSFGIKIMLRSRGDWEIFAIYGFYFLKNFFFWKGAGPKSYFWHSRLRALDVIFYGLSFGMISILRTLSVKKKIKKINILPFNFFSIFGKSQALSLFLD
jgi:hypothetical protein